jgi:tetratricopeptide (TPR) repeat protein
MNKNKFKILYLFAIMLLLTCSASQTLAADNVGQRLTEVEKRLGIIENQASKNDQNDNVVKYVLSISSDTVKYVGIVAAIILPFLLLLIGYQIFRSYQFEKEIRDTRKLMSDEYDKMREIRGDSEKFVDEIKRKIGALEEFVGTLATDFLQKKSVELFIDIKEKTNQAIADFKTKDEELKHNIELMKKLEALDLTLTPSVYKERGTIYFGQGNLEQAIDNYSNAIRLKPDDVEAYFHRGLAHQRVKKYQEAIQDYTKTIQLNPKDQNAYANMGVCYRQIKEIEKSLQNFNRAIEINPNLLFALVNRGLTYAIMGKTDLALADVEKAEQKKPGSPNLLTSIGLTYGKMGNFKMAIEYYLKSKEIDDNLLNKLNLADAYICNKQYEDSKKMATEIFSATDCDTRSKIFSKFMRVTAMILNDNDYNEDLKSLIETMKEAVEFSIDNWSFDELLSCLSDKSLQKEKTDLVKKMISLLKKEITSTDFTINE